MSCVPWLHHCPYCDADDENEREAEAADFEAMIEVHLRPQDEGDMAETPNPGSPSGD